METNITENIKIIKTVIVEDDMTIKYDKNIYDSTEDVR